MRLQRAVDGMFPPPLHLDVGFRVIDLVRKGWPDRIIASYLQITPKKVRKMRQQKGLPSNALIRMGYVHKLHAAIAL